MKGDAAGHLGVLGAVVLATARFRLGLVADLVLREAIIDRPQTGDHQQRCEQERLAKGGENA